MNTGREKTRQVGNLRTKLTAAIMMELVCLIWYTQMACAVFIDPDAGPKTAVAGEATLTFNPETPGQITDWTVGGISHLASQDFWFRVGDDGPERPIAMDNEATVEYHAPCITCTNDARHANMATHFFQPDIQDFLILVFLRLSSDSTTDHSELLMSISPAFTPNTTGQSRPPITVHIFQLVHFNFFSASMNCVVEVENNTTITQSTTQGPWASVTQTLTSDPASHVQVGDYASLYALFQDDQPTTLNDFAGPFESNDTAWVLQWDVTIDPEAPETPFISTFSLEVPEPSTLYLTLALALLCRSRRRASAR